MGIKVPSATDVADKWNRRVSTAGDDYKNGVEDPSVDWEGPAKASEDTYKEGVIKAANEGRFARGIVNAGNTKWRKNTTEKGPGRWTEGVSNAKPDYESGMGKVLGAIGSVSLPKRYPAGDDRNIDRVRAVTKAVHNATKGK